MRFFAILAWSILSLAISVGAIAQDEQVREQDIKAAIDNINGPDHLAGAIAAEDALKSSDPILRSMALEAAMRSDDGRIREVALQYILTVQKNIVVNIEIDPDKLNEIPNEATKKVLANISPLALTIRSFDKTNLTFVTGTNLGPNYDGALTQDGMTLTMNLYRTNCALKIRGYERGKMLGSLTCGKTSFAASASLP